MKGLLKSIAVSILAWDAKHILAKYNPKVIAVIGSVGKTGTKDAIHTALNGSLSVRKSKKSLNSDMGVPLTVIGCESGWSNPFKWLGIFAHGLMLIFLKNTYPEWLVLEVGMDKPGEMRGIAKWLKPDIVVITSLPTIPVHVANFNSVEDVIQEKLSIAHALKPDGTFILNGDDEKIKEVMGAFEQKKIFYTKDNITSAIQYTDEKPLGMQFTIKTISGNVEVLLRGILGEQLSYLVLATLSVCEVLNLDVKKCARALQNYEAPSGRMKIIEGIENTTIIDDSYNSSPIALAAALDALDKLQMKGKKIAVLGDMRELGEFSEREHAKAGEHAAEVVDMLITIGEESKVLATAAHSAGLAKENIKSFGYYDSIKAGEYVRGILKDSDVVLVKGSQNKIRTERVVKAIMEQPERAPELLVRQEREWLNRK